MDQNSICRYTLTQSSATAEVVAPVFGKGRGDRNRVAAGGAAVISCSKTAPETSATTSAQTELPLGDAVMHRVSTPPVTMGTLSPMSVSVGAPVASFAESCHRVCVPRWKPARLLDMLREHYADFSAEPPAT